jgi:hypothetical protein
VTTSTCVLVIGLALGLVPSLDAKTHHRKAALTGRVRRARAARPISRHRQTPGKHDLLLVRRHLQLTTSPACR